MRTLKFIIDGQIIKQDPTCDFTNLIPGTEGYLQAEFSFSKEWDGCIKVASFKSAMGKEYTPQLLVKGKTCDIPNEALSKKLFRVGIIGKKGDLKLTTNYIDVYQNGGGV